MMKGQRTLVILLLRSFQRLANPVCPVEIADAARRVFQIGLELKHRVSETLVTNPFGIEKTAEENVAVPS
jgi:hypothetical protein